jgi:hypothetical protein
MSFGGLAWGGMSFWAGLMGVHPRVSQRAQGVEMSHES